MSSRSESVKETKMEATTKRSHGEDGNHQFERELKRELSRTKKREEAQKVMEVVVLVVVVVPARIKDRRKVVEKEVNSGKELELGEVEEKITTRMQKMMIAIEGLKRRGEMKIATVAVITEDEDMMMMIIDPRVEVGRGGKDPHAVVI